MKKRPKLFAKTFFLDAPNTSTDYSQFNYPEPLPNPLQINQTQLTRHIAKLSPYKAHGPDGIPNIMIQKCMDLILDRLTLIFKTILEKGIYFDKWRGFTTVVLRKPSKPSYETHKAYQPIALISTMAKILTSIVVENLSQTVELHQLLPKTHFGGRPGRSTTDAIHYLVHRITTTWRENKVVSVLFLDVEGALPNAVPAKVIHNLKKRHTPTSIINFIKLLLNNRKTRLKFDDCISKIIMVTNGIGQGDPLSMILYIIYNADLLEIPNMVE